MEPIDSEKPFPVVGAVLLAVALMLAGGAWVIGERAVAQKHDAVRRGWNFTKVVAEAKDLPAGSVLAREDLEPRDVPEPMVTASLFTDARAAEGKTLTSPLKKGTPLSPAAFADRSACP